MFSVTADLLSSRSIERRHRSFVGGARTCTPAHDIARIACTCMHPRPELVAQLSVPLGQCRSVIVAIASRSRIVFQHLPHLPQLLSLTAPHKQIAGLWRHLNTLAAHTFTIHSAHISLTSFAKHIGVSPRSSSSITLVRIFARAVEQQLTRVCTESSASQRTSQKPTQLGLRSQADAHPYTNTQYHLSSSSECLLAQ
jgi:hypothetical protein